MYWCYFYVNIKYYDHTIYGQTHMQKIIQTYMTMNQVYIKNKSVCIWQSFYGLVIICYTSENIQKFRKNTYLMDYSKYI